MWYWYVLLMNIGIVDDMVLLLMMMLIVDDGDDDVLSCVVWLLCVCVRYYW
jgi:hypothetical protein